MTALPLSLIFHCRDLPSNALRGVRIAVGFVTIENDAYNEIYQSETVRFSVDPKFNRPCNLDYKFAELQRLKIFVYEVSEEERIVGVLGATVIDIADVLCQAHGEMRISLAVGHLLIKSFADESCTSASRVQLRGHGLTTKTSKKLAPYFSLNLVLDDDGHSLLLHKSDAVNDENPVWKSFVIPTVFFEPFRRNTLEIVCWNQSENLSDELLGRCGTTLAELTWGVGPQNVHKLLNPNRRNAAKERGTVELILMDAIGIHSFLDYIQTGTQIHFTVAVDFTASNGKPTDAKSLHYIHPHSMNFYMKALSVVGTVVEKYSRSQKMVGLGFGAQVPPKYEVSHAFFMNGSHDPHVDGVDGLLAAYRHALLSIRPFAPTDYAPVIHHVAKFASASSRQGFEYYFVLLILTDGCVNDEQRTIDAIVAASRLPMSIVVLGIGDGDFAAMKQLQSTELKARDGTRLIRDVIKFVHFNEIASGKILDRVPQQLQQWAILENRKAGL